MLPALVHVALGARTVLSAVVVSVLLYEVRLLWEAAQVVFEGLERAQDLPQPLVRAL